MMFTLEESRADRRRGVCKSVAADIDNDAAAPQATAVEYGELESVPAWDDKYLAVGDVFSAKARVSLEVVGDSTSEVTRIYEGLRESNGSSAAVCKVKPLHAAGTALDEARREYGVYSRKRGTNR